MYIYIHINIKIIVDSLLKKINKYIELLRQLTSIKNIKARFCGQYGRLSACTCKKKVRKIQYRRFRLGFRNLELEKKAQWYMGMRTQSKIRVLN